jgi:hypothetical protein
MKILVIICSNEMSGHNIDNIKIMNDYFKNDNANIVEYCGISNSDDFANYESIISFKYKIINSKFQLSKICDFITEYKNTLNYDWYIKIRPDLRLFEKINFEILSDTKINGRARVYTGPQKILYGMSINGDGIWKNTGDCYYDDSEKEIILDDMIYIFHHNVILMNAFEKFDSNEPENEWVHTNLWKCRNINLNVIGINLQNTKHYAYSGNVNI